MRMVTVMIMIVGVWKMAELMMRKKDRLMIDVSDDWICLVDDSNMEFVKAPRGELLHMDFECGAVRHLANEERRNEKYVKKMCGSCKERWSEKAVQEMELLKRNRRRL